MAEDRAPLADPLANFGNGDAKQEHPEEPQLQHTLLLLLFNKRLQPTKRYTDNWRDEAGD